MKKEFNRKIICVIFFVVAMLFLRANKVSAANVSINCPNTAKINSPINITVSGSAVQWNLKLLVDGVEIASSNELENYKENKTISFSGNYVPKTEGNKNVTLVGSITEESDGSTIKNFPARTILIEKEASTNNDTANSAGNTANNNTQIPPTTGQTKSSNANLKNLGIRPNDFSGFKSGTTTYNVTVPNNVTSVELYAVKQDAKATISGTGQKTLQEGINKLSVVVTAEDGTKKTYTVNVTREAEKDNKEPEKEEETENKVEEKLETENNNEEIGEGLAELKIEGVELNKEFKIGEYEYTAKYIGEATSLNIEAIPSNESYVVEIIGNKDLKEGENIVTILVSDKDGNNIATYQITVNKSLVDEEAIAREEAKKQEEKKRNIIIFGSIASLVIIILIVVIIIKNRRKNSYGEDYSIPYSGINSENNPDNYYDNSNLINDKADDDFEEPVKKVKRNKGKRFK